ncbi:MAG: hypothetical protein ABID09_03680 [Candidatus Omnitrophota bacterium]
MGRNYNTYLYAIDNANKNTGWPKIGTWNLNHHRPQTGTVTPNSGSSNPGQKVTFTTTYTDGDGWDKLCYATLLINRKASSLGATYVYYKQNDNLLYLYNRATRSWIGGYKPGSANTIENEYAILHCADSTVTGFGTTLTVKWSLTFKEAFSGRTHNMYLRAMDDGYLKTSVDLKGTWSMNTPPQIGTLSPNSGTSNVGEDITFTTTYTDQDGWEKLYYGLILINETPSATSAVYGYYQQENNILYLYQAGTGWIGGYEPGSANTIENQYGILDCSKTTVSGSGNTLTVNWNLSFKEEFNSSLKNVYLKAMDDAYVKTPLVKKGTWQVN